MREKITIQILNNCKKSKDLQKNPNLNEFSNKLILYYILKLIKKILKVQNNFIPQE